MEHRSAGVGNRQRHVERQRAGAGSQARCKQRPEQRVHRQREVRTPDSREAGPQARSLHIALVDSHPEPRGVVSRRHRERRKTMASPVVRRPSIAYSSSLGNRDGESAPGFGRRGGFAAGAPGGVGCGGPGDALRRRLGRRGGRRPAWPADGDDGAQGRRAVRREGSLCSPSLSCRTASSPSCART